MIEDEKQTCEYSEDDFRYEVDVKRRGMLSSLCLAEENACYADTPGISSNNREQGFLPAFQDRRTGCCVISRFADGRPAPVHLLEGLPEAWIEERQPNGLALRVCSQIVSGFLLNGCFYTRDEASRLILKSRGASALRPSGEN
ncbi:MAG: dihydroorotase [Gammaproteobacteria bacterium]|nr:dihydroorotase [Gammaproteobacteria bacterium]